MHAGSVRFARRRRVAALEDAGNADGGDDRREGDLLSFLYFVQDAHFRRTAEESGINEYSGATERRVGLCTGWREMREREREGEGRKIEWSAREEAGRGETHGGGEIEDGCEKMP